MHCQFVRLPLALLVAGFLQLAETQTINAGPTMYTAKLLYSVGSDPGISANAGGLGSGNDFATETQGAIYDADGNITIIPSNLVSPGNYSYFLKTDGHLAVGITGIVNRGNTGQAFIWDIDQNQSFNLNPAGATQSQASGFSGDQIAGFAKFTVNIAGQTQQVYHPVVWNGANHTLVDLTPSTVPGSISNPQGVAIATDGVHQVGSVNEFGAYWSGTAASFQELGYSNIPALDRATAVALHGNQIVGYGDTINGVNHPLLWNGVSDVATDLLPSGVSSGAVRDTNGLLQVGYVTVDANNDLNAVVWSGTSDSMVDLEQNLPANLPYSVAESIDAEGNIFGIGTDNETNYTIVEWSPVPEPGITLLGLPLIGLLRRRR